MFVIPVPEQVDKNIKIPSPSIQPGSWKTRIIFSFQLLEKNEYFGIDKRCSGWASELFFRLKDISSFTINELRSGQVGTCRIHNHEKATPPIQIPHQIAQKDFVQIRVGKSKGGIHGVFVENIFFVVWLDPLHNMWPDDKHGGLKQVQMPCFCCDEMEKTKEKLANKTKECVQLKADYEALYDEIK